MGKEQSKTRNLNYTCTSCGRETPKKHLTAKRVDFSTYGRNSKRLRTRTVGRLCPECRDKDPAWNQPRFTESPGFDDLKDRE